MTARLDQLISSARELDAAWDGERSERVREAALRLRSERVRRHRALRRGLVVASGAGLLVLALLRGAASAPAELQASRDLAPAPTAEALAVRALTDAGYARD